MKQALILCFALSATPVLADDGTSKMSKGAELLMEGLLQELAPMIQDMEELGTQIAPTLEALNKSLGEGLQNLDAYHAPEILPNGDILIRRKTPIAATPPEGQIDL